MGEFVKLEIEDGVGTIRLDRPKMNALNKQVQEEIRDCAREASANDEVKAVIVYGGEKVFAAGADIKEMEAMTYQEMAVRAHELQACFTAVAEIPKPTVAAITGYALGGGMELAMCCDIRICADDANVGQPEILLGIIPGGGGTQRLARLVGPAKAKDINYTGRFVAADEALRIGMVDQVVPAGEVYAAAQKWAGQFRNSASLALRAVKAAVDGGLNGDLATGLKLESNLFAALFATEDQKIGMKSFIENGPGKAQFTGK
ncbi:enoyl-CoA hydratase/isomerase family protein [Blastococcus sp. Marseille-P5729]|uniref:enoyl-CoA hydratase/isomerase family protein n=1 Tax=Blastococcus sp. Marseille-P5729 TaxID=2086582 RepID=UPI000D0F12B4|nr:enoyl-CoA hydratase-related protein [Blastococcus sp. Marseille-P5729]